MQPEPPASANAPHTGAMLLGGAHGALALARSFGRNGIPVVLVTDDHPLPKFSRYVQRRFDWPGANAAETPRWLVQLAEREGLRDWLLVPCGDGEVEADRHQSAVDAVHLPRRKLRLGAACARCATSSCWRNRPRPPASPRRAPTGCAAKRMPRRSISSFRWC